MKMNHSTIRIGRGRGRSELRSAGPDPDTHSPHPRAPVPERADPGRWTAVETRDSRRDGTFFYAVTSTGVFCRPSCPSRRPRPDRVLFFNTAAEAERAGYRPCLRCRPTEPVRLREVVDGVCRFIEAHCDEPLTLGALARQAGLSRFYLHRAFKRRTGLTPREYGEACRHRALKAGLQAGHPVTRALFDAGYGSTSRLYERSDARLGMTPATYGRRGRGARIRYAIGASVVGKVLLGATEKGVCSIGFGDSESDLVGALKREFARAMFSRDQAGLRPWLRSVDRYLRGSQREPALPLDIHATAFQWRVWKHLQTIPRGSTRSYAVVAAALGRRGAARAVARACSSNPVAGVIPCHRVVRRDGGLGGYRWGLKRKKRLLEEERRASHGQAAVSRRGSDQNQNAGRSRKRIPMSRTNCSNSSSSGVEERV